MASNKPLSKTKYSKCGYCSSGLLDQNLKTHCQEAHGQPKLVAGEKQITTFFPKKQRADSNDVHVDQDGGTHIFALCKLSISELICYCFLVL